MPISAANGLSVLFVRHTGALRSCSTKCGHTGRQSGHSQGFIPTSWAAHSPKLRLRRKSKENQYEYEKRCFAFAGLERGRQKEVRAAMKPFLAKDWARQDAESKGCRPKRLCTVKRLIDGQWRDVQVYESIQTAMQRKYGPPEEIGRIGRRKFPLTAS